MFEGRATNGRAFAVGLSKVNECFGDVSPLELHSPFSIFRPEISGNRYAGGPVGSRLEKAYLLHFPA